MHVGDLSLEASEQDSQSGVSTPGSAKDNRIDPFLFGKRFLTEGDNIFEHNAWDHVETDEGHKQYAEVQYAKQREAPVSEFDKSKSILLLLYATMTPARFLMIPIFNV